MNLSTRRNKGQGLRRRGSWRRPFLAALRKMPNVAAACRKAHVSQPTAYLARNTSKAFARQWEQAISTGVQGLEETLWRIANEGERDPIWKTDKDGNPVKVDELYRVNVAAAVFLLKAHAPDKYRDRTQTEIVGAGGGPVQATFAVNLCEDELPKPKEVAKAYSGLDKRPYEECRADDYNKGKK